MRARPSSLVALAFLASAGCLPDLGGYQVIGGGAIECDFTLPTLAVLVNEFPGPSRIEILELGDGPRHCGTLDAGGDLDEYHGAMTWLPDRPVILLADARTWEAVDVTRDEYAAQMAPPSTVQAGGFDAFALLDGDHYVGAFVADGGRTSSIDVEQVLFWDLGGSPEQVSRSPGDLDLGAAIYTIDCTADPQNPAAMLCIRGRASSFGAAAAVEARPFQDGWEVVERIAGPTDVVFDRISSVPGGRIAWRGQRDGTESFGYWFARPGETTLSGPLACPNCAATGEVIPDPSNPDGFFVACEDAAGNGLLLRGDTSSCATVLDLGEGRPSDLSVRVP